MTTTFRNIPTFAIILFSAPLLLTSGETTVNRPVNCQLKWAPMRDGVRLATEVHRLDNAQKMPVIMIRTPYNHTYATNKTKISELRCDPNRYAATVARGYVVISQDVRGTARSEGVFRPIQQEADWNYQLPLMNFNAFKGIAPF